MKESAAVTAAVPSREKGGRPALVLLWCLMGLLVPRAVLYGQMAPCGVSLAAAATVGALPVSGAVLAGYLLAGEAILPLRYMAAVAVVIGARWVLSALPELAQKRFVPPLLAFVATAATGLAVLGQNGLDGWQVLLILAEGALAAGGALFFHTAMTWSDQWLTAQRPEHRPALDAGQQAAVILTGAVAVMAASTLTLGGISPGRALAVLLVLVLARSGRESGGCTAGVVLGAAIAMAAPGQTALAMAMAFGGLIAGVFSRLGRVAEALAFFIAAGAVTLAEADADALFHLYEVLIAGILLVLMPKQWDRRLCHLFIRGQDLPAAEGLRRAVSLRLAVASRALEEVSDTVGVVSERLAHGSAPDTAALFRGCCSAVCGNCPLHLVCWEQNRDDMMASLETLPPLLRRQGTVNETHFTGWLAQQCRQPERVAAYLTRGYADMVAQESAWRRLEELQDSLRHQFGAMGALLTDLATDLQRPGQVDVELSGRVLAVCRDYGMPVRDALCSRRQGNRLTVEILMGNIGVPLNGGRWLKEIQEVCDRNFAPPATVECGRDVRVTLTEVPRYAVEIGIAQRCCDGEKLCGDAVDSFSIHGRTVVVLSDGMGSGGRAAVDGAMSVGLTARLWKAGFSPNSILQTVNASLLVKSRQESLATLDVVAVDEFSGRVDSYKAGAAASLLCCGGRVSRMERTSLPVGILPDVAFEHSHDWLTEGDILLLVSDGALAGGMAAVETLLQDFPKEEGMQALADRVVSAARAAETEHPDDVTAVAMRLRYAE